MRRKLFLIIIALAIFAIALYKFINILQQVVAPVNYPSLIVGTAEVPGLVEETLILFVNSNQDALTSHSYAGLVTITIDGKGQIDTNTGHDALYKYRYEFENGSYPLYCCFDGFQIDGKAVTRFSFSFGDSLYSGSGVSPDYNPNHKYRFLFNVGSQIRKIGFRIMNGNPNDKSSRFEVEVSTENKLALSGR